VQQNDSNKDLEAMLELAEQDLNDFNENKDSHAAKFIRDLTIEPGEDFIPSFIIYYIYCFWRSRDRDPLNGFIRDFAKIFERKSKNGESGFYLDNSNNLFDTSIEFRLEAREFIRKSRQKREQAKKRKKHKKKQN